MKCSNCKFWLRSGALVPGVEPPVCRIDLSNPFGLCLHPDMGAGCSPELINPPPGPERVSAVYAWLGGPERACLVVREDSGCRHFQAL